jgi:hypothetical protein
MSQTRIESDIDRAKRAMHWSHMLIVLAVCAMLVAALVFELTDMGPPPRTALEDGAVAVDKSTPCGDLSGRKLERCEVLHQKQPREYNAQSADR